MKNTPERIYLQIGFEPDAYTDFNKIAVDGSVSWCADKINESDIEYVNQAEFDRLRAQNARLLEALKEVKQTIRAWHGMGMQSELEVKMWGIYETTSPEMQRLNTTITEAE